MTTLGQLLAPIQPQLAALEQRLLERLESPIPLIQDICQHLLTQGGKRLRPSLVLLLAAHFEDMHDGQLELALIIEFIHNVTLLHDDVVDGSEQRRGQATANALWSNQASVLVGDFLLARSFQLLVDLSHLPLMHLLAQTTQDIAAGEVMQLSHRQNPNTTITRYLDVIRHKTATLFAAATQGSAMLANRSPAELQSAYNFGLHFGMAFQLIDDALDYAADNPELDKNAGDDLAEGKPTLPLLYALEHATPQQQTVIREAITQADHSQFRVIVDIIHQTGGIAYTQEVARDYAARAQQDLNQLPATNYQKTLCELVDFAVARAY